MHVTKTLFLLHCDAILQCLLFFREVHLFGGRLPVQTSAGLLPLPYLRPDLPDRHHVLDFILDQTGGGSGTCHTWSNEVELIRLIQILYFLENLILNQN